MEYLYNSKKIAIEYKDKDENQCVTEVAYLDLGYINKEVIICTHGLTRNSHDFDYLATELKEKYRVISIDIPGRGESAFLNNPMHYNYDTYVKVVKNFLDKLGITKVYWIGTSMGGLIALHLNYANPNIIQKLVINDVGPILPIDSLKRISKYINNVPLFKTVEELEKHLRKTLAPFGITQDEHWQYLAKHSYRKLSDGNLTLAYDPNISMSFVNFDEITNDIELWPLWEPVNMETLVLRGENSDILPKTCFEKMLEKPNVEGYEFSNVGHAPALMNSEQINVIKNWFK
ncbi:MAG: alpha/beta hydrolase [Sphingobacteriia bacterium]|nr:alpha/beta hydrolase [Sphingobacteriia bacterium]